MSKLHGLSPMIHFLIYYKSESFTKEMREEIFQKNPQKNGTIPDLSVSLRGLIKNALNWFSHPLFTFFYNCVLLIKKTGFVYIFTRLFFTIKFSTIPKNCNKIAMTE